MMEQLIADFISRMGLALPVTILVAVSAGKVIHTINSLNLETQITNLTVDVIKEMWINSIFFIAYIGILLRMLTYQLR